MTDSYSTFDDEPGKDHSGQPPDKVEDESTSFPPLPEPTEEGFDAATGVWDLETFDGLDAKDHDSFDFETSAHGQSELTGMPERIGDYVIERMLGSGGMGHVFLAKHQTMQRVVAIKTLPPEQTSQEWAVNRFYEEVRAAARLLHPNIATAFDAGLSNGVHFLAMEYIEGLTLNSLVARHGPMALGDAVSAIRGAARGLAHAHAAGIVHRDVKPGNLMRGPDGTVKVVDLGLALFATPQHLLQASARKELAARNAGRLVGTVAFMSPEQLENPDTVDYRSDIYSLGATLYFLLTGRPPYEGAFLEQIRAIRHDPVPELFSHRPDVDLRLEHVFRRMMAKRPQERYASLVEVIADLASYDVAEANTSWVSSLGNANVVGDISTIRGGSTGGEIAKVMGIDFGMFFATCAIAEPAGATEVLMPGDGGRVQQRLAIADGTPLLFGEEAASRRESQPGSVLHCAPLYVGQAKVDYQINGRRCPAEVLLAIQLRKLVELYWPERVMPHAVAITVPSSYDQFHRQALIQAANIAGIRSVRLVDRALASLQAWRFDKDRLSRLDSSAENDSEPVTRGPGGERPQVVVSITGHATEVVVTRYRGSRVQQLSAVGQWHLGTLQWQQRLVDLVAEECQRTHQFDPRTDLKTAASLQIACERALPKFLLLESANVVFQRQGRPIAVAVARDKWLQRCESLMDDFLSMIDAALEAADINPDRVGHCLLMGILTRIGLTRKKIESKFGADTEFVLIERTDIARGAALCVAGEMPGRGDLPLPPQSATTHDFGLLVVDHKNRRRIRPIIPRGTVIPARTNRRIANAGTSSSQTLTVVESSTWRETAWRSLGSHRFSVDANENASELTFEVDIDGRLVVRRRDASTGGFLKLPSLPKPTLTYDELTQWADWLKEWMPSTKRRAVDA